VPHHNRRSAVGRGWRADRFATPLSTDSVHDSNWPIVCPFCEQHLKADGAMGSASIKSYRDAVKLFLTFVASECQLTITMADTEDRARA
jgi:hypothetical protein